MQLLALLDNILPTPSNGNPSAVMKDTLDLFSTWIGRVGGLVAFVGAVKFALSVKGDDAKEQMLALLTMISGFMIQNGVKYLSVAHVEDAAKAAEEDFDSLITFISIWTARLGGAGFLLGAVLFALAIRDNNATTKINGVKTIAAGAMIISIAGILRSFI